MINIPDGFYGFSCGCDTVSMLAPHVYRCAHGRVLFAPAIDQKINSEPEFKVAAHA